MKLNRAHRCSVCNKTGHRRETCPKRRPTKAMKQNRLDKETQYTTSIAPPRVNLRDLKQEGFPAFARMTERQAQNKLLKLGVLPGCVRSFDCWKCGDKMTKTGLSFRCPRKHCNCKVSRADLAYTPLYHWARGGHMSYKALLLAMYAFGLKVPVDAAMHVLGLSYDATESMYRCLKHAAAFAELHTGRQIEFPSGTLEFDATKSVTARKSKKLDKHCGRFLVVFHRETKQFALEPLLDKHVKKGAPPPPETYAEVKPLIKKTVKPGHVVSTDSAPAYKKVLKNDFKKGSVPHATVVHKSKNFASVVHFPVKSLSPEVQKLAASLPTSTSRTFRFKAGDQRAENVFGVVKRNVARLNLQRSSRNASVNFLTAGWLSKNLGLDGVAKAMKVYRSVLRSQRRAPREAYKCTKWLTSLEPVP